MQKEVMESIFEELKKLENSLALLRWEHYSGLEESKKM